MLRYQHRLIIQFSLHIFLLSLLYLQILFLVKFAEHTLSSVILKGQFHLRNTNPEGLSCNSSSLLEYWGRFGWGCQSKGGGFGVGVGQDLPLRFVVRPSIVVDTILPAGDYVFSWAVFLQELNEKKYFTLSKLSGNNLMLQWILRVSSTLIADLYCTQRYIFYIISLSSISSYAIIIIRYILCCAVRDISPYVQYAVL